GFRLKLGDRTRRARHGGHLPLRLSTAKATLQALEQRRLIIDHENALQDSPPSSSSGDESVPRSCDHSRLDDLSTRWSPKACTLCRGATVRMITNSACADAVQRVRHRREPRPAQKLPEM